MFKDFVPLSKRMLLAGLVSGILVSTGFAQSAQGKGSSAVTPPAASSPAPSSPASSKKASQFRTQLSRRAQNYYQLIWGVDSFSVKSVESGKLIRFDYRVIDAEKAKPLNDKKSEPFLVDQKAGVKLVVPTLEKVGQLRQSMTPEAGKIYWMVFSNKGNHVKKGSRVSVVIGKFHVDGLVVQ